MANANDLNFEITLYNNGVKVCRQIGNFLIPNHIVTCLQYFMDVDRNFYTDIEVKYQDRVILFEPLSKWKNDSSFTDPSTLLK